MDDSERPDKIALNFTDPEGLVVLLKHDKEDSGYYYVKHIFKDNVHISVPDESNFAYLQISFHVERINDTIMIKNGVDVYEEFYFIDGNECLVIKNDAVESGYELSVIVEDGEFRYSKTNWKYYTPQTFEGIVEAYESDKDFYHELGTLAIEGGKVTFVPETTRTFGEWYQSDLNSFRNYRDKYQAKTFTELKAIYEQYAKEGRKMEFFE